jgi:hypothetical protein
MTSPLVEARQRWAKVAKEMEEAMQNEPPPFGRAVWVQMVMDRHTEAVVEMAKLDARIEQTEMQEQV